MRLEIGNLVLAQQLRASYEPITVENSEATMELEVAQCSTYYCNSIKLKILILGVASPMIGQIQRIQLILSTNEDTIQQGEITVMSQSNLEILNFPDGNMKLTSENGESRLVSFSFTEGKLVMPKCCTHETIELFLPVRAPIGCYTHEVCIKDDKFYHSIL